MKERLDRYLVNNNFTYSRTKAKELIKSGSIKVNDNITTKASYNVKDNDKVEIIDGSSIKYVSRAGLKLEGAIESFNLEKRVVAIDVGTDLMANSLRNDERVELHEQLNFKNATSNLFEGIDLIVSDVSFISLKHIIDRISLEDEDFELVFLIKPQFECGKEIADKFKGIINDKEVHKDVILDIIAYFKKYGYNIIDLDVSKIQGKSGNIEYLAHFKRTEDATNIDIETIVNKAFFK